jgi:hypothetical protein
MITDSALSLATLEALETSLPASPRSIPPDIALADLEQIRTGWLAQAQVQQLPERLFEIGYWLGARDPDNRGDFRCLYAENMVIWASIKQGTRNVPANAWNTMRRLTVYVGDSLVMDWQWYYFSQSLEDTPEDPKEGLSADLLYIPGEWTSRALALHPQAERTRIGIAHSASIADRDALARRMLVGREV